MAKSKRSVPSAPAPTEAPRTIPLSGLEITYAWRSHFSERGDESATRTITGGELSAVLAWMGRSAPNQPTRFDDVDHIGQRIRGLGYLCELLANSTTLGTYPNLDADALTTLSEILVDYGTRIEVQGEITRKYILAHEVTIAPATQAPASGEAA